MMGPSYTDPNRRAMLVSIQPTTARGSRPGQLPPPFCNVCIRKQLARPPCPELRRALGHSNYYNTQANLTFAYTARSTRYTSYSNNLPYVYLGCESPLTVNLDARTAKRPINVSEKVIGSTATTSYIYFRCKHPLL